MTNPLSGQELSAAHVAWVRLPAESRATLFDAQTLFSAALDYLRAELAKEEPKAWIEHHKGGDNLDWDKVDHPYAKASPLYLRPSEPSKGAVLLREVFDTLGGSQVVNTFGMEWYESACNVLGPSTSKEKDQ